MISGRVPTTVIIFSFFILFPRFALTVSTDWASKSAIAVSESGNIIAIGSEKANANGIDSGQVSVYKYSIDTNSWIKLGTVINGETAGDFFGSSLSLSHDSTQIKPHNLDYYYEKNQALQQEYASLEYNSLV